MEERESLLRGRERERCLSSHLSCLRVLLGRAQPPGEGVVDRPGESWGGTHVAWNRGFFPESRLMLPPAPLAQRKC